MLRQCWIDACFSLAFHRLPGTTGRRCDSGHSEQRWSETGLASGHVRHGAEQLRRIYGPKRRPEPEAFFWFVWDPVGAWRRCHHAACAGLWTQRQAPAAGSGGAFELSEPRRVSARCADRVVRKRSARLGTRLHVISTTCKFRDRPARDRAGDDWGCILKLRSPREVALLDSTGQAVLRYGDLTAWDARGQRLASRLRVEGNQVRLVVEDSRAVYPVTIDPTVTQIMLVPNDGAGSASLGQSVAIDGNTAVVGAPSEGGLTGAAYSFVLSNGIWTQQAKLTASDGASGDQVRNIGFVGRPNGSNRSPWQLRPRSSLRVRTVLVPPGLNRPSSPLPTARAAINSASPSQ